MRCSISAGSMQRVSSSMSANTAVAPSENTGRHDAEARPGPPLRPLPSRSATGRSGGPAGLWRAPRQGVRGTSGILRRRGGHSDHCSPGDPVKPWDEQFEPSSDQRRSGTVVGQDTGFRTSALKTVGIHCAPSLCGQLRLGKMVQLLYQPCNEMPSTGGAVYVSDPSGAGDTCGEDPHAGPDSTWYHGPPRRWVRFAA
jgi:hypothetical protein